MLSVGPEVTIAGNTLYAKWIEYIPTLKEVIAMEANTVTKAKGVVTYINGRNAYIQDASAGMLLYMKANPTFQVGQLVVVKGTKTLFGGAPELKDVEEDRAEAGTLPTAISFDNLASVTAEPLKYFGQRVAFRGLLIADYDANGNPKVTDNVDTVLCYKMVLDQAVYPINTKVNLTAIAGYYNGFQFVGDIAGFEMVGGAGKDNFNYPAYGDNGAFLRAYRRSDIHPRAAKRVLVCGNNRVGVYSCRRVRRGDNPGERTYEVHTPQGF